MECIPKKNGDSALDFELFYDPVAVGATGEENS